MKLVTWDSVHFNMEDYHLTNYSMMLHYPRYFNKVFVEFGSIASAQERVLIEDKREEPMPFQPTPWRRK